MVDLQFKHIVLLPLFLKLILQLLIELYDFVLLLNHLEFVQVLTLFLESPWPHTKY